jgi:hypothetical protein
MLPRFWAWYYRIGEPLELYTRLSVQECMQRLNDATVSWDTRNPFGAKRYKSMLLYDGQFKLKSRRNPSERAFAGKLESAPNGKTRITGQLINDTNFPYFAGFLLVVAPLVGFYFYGRIGLVIGIIIGVLLIMAGIYARMVEDHNRAIKELHSWLMDTLDASPEIIDGSVGKVITRSSK